PHRKFRSECRTRLPTAKSNRGWRHREDFFPPEFPAATACLDFRRDVSESPVAAQTARPWRKAIARQSGEAAKGRRESKMSARRLPRSDRPVRWRDHARPPLAYSDAKIANARRRRKKRTPPVRSPHRVDFCAPDLRAPPAQNRWRQFRL